VHDQVQGRLECTFEDIGEQSLKNIARPVRVYRVALTHPGADAPWSPLSRTAGEGAERQRRETGEGLAAALALPDKPLIAVLPYQNMSGDPEPGYFADGMVEEVITALSRIRWLFVIARNSSFTYKGQTIDVKRVGRELGVRYVLEGSVRKGGGRVRITGRLEEARAGLGRLRAIDPALRIAGYRAFLTPIALPEFVDLVVTGLRLAGLPEG
jgi:adenylate cyclase